MIHGVAGLLMDYDAPHTGARLETEALHASSTFSRMPPTRGHDLKRMEADDIAVDIRCPPHGGTT